MPDDKTDRPWLPDWAREQIKEDDACRRALTSEAALAWLRDFLPWLRAHPEARLGRGTAEHAETDRRLDDAVAVLGERRIEAAVPLLAELWRWWPAIGYVWMRIGHALFAIGTSEALAVLREGLRDEDTFKRHLAIKAVLAEDPNRAYDRMSRYFGSDDSRIAADTFIFLERTDHPLPDWPPEGIPIIERDERWLALCASVRKHHRLGAHARVVLQQLEPDRVVPLMQSVVADEAARGIPAPPRVERDGTLLRRYRDGERETVWNEIRVAGNVASAFRDEALEVANVTMARVAENADRISERLAAEGWRAPSRDALRTRPKETDAGIVASIEEISGARLPPTLAAFWRVVGGIDWVWDHDAGVERPDMGLSVGLHEMDPLCVYPPGLVSYLVKEWSEREPVAHSEIADPFDVDLSPDRTYKSGYAGGGPYEIALPTRLADPFFENEPHRLPFVDYLRLAFRWCGIPGLEQHADRADVRDFLRRFGQSDLVPF